MPRETMTLAVETDRAGRVVVAVRGEVDQAAAVKLMHKLDRLVTEGRARIVLDMSGVRFCGAQALSALVRTRARADRAGGWLRLAGTPPHVRKVIAVTDLDRLLPNHEDVASALLGRRAPADTKK
ncbi:STAS domain-containing protein [Umezawaea sp.]|uniref:STAS domain-containing protein n=1 Tax=Umezawaea sp. TaxID=1955258 RepID=UPI002ED55013